MITLYHCANARSLRVLWALEELELGYELKMLPFPPRFLARDYLEINPLGTIPFLIDGETRMTELSAICHYLAARENSALAVAPHEPGFGAYLNGLFQGEATLTFPQTVVIRFSRWREDQNKPDVAAEYSRWFKARLRMAEQILAGADYYAADRFTVADISIGYALMLAIALGLDDGFSERLRDYWDRLSSRPAFLRAQVSQAKAGEEQGVPGSFI